MKFTSFADFFDVFWRVLAMYALVLMLLILNFESFNYPLTGSINAPFFLAALYYWGIYRPGLIPVWMVFLCGFATDLITASPVGLHTLLFIVFSWVVVDQRRFLVAQNFAILWFIFCALGLVFGILKWGFFSVLQKQILTMDGVFIGTALVSALFPLMHLLLNATHRIAPMRWVGSREHF